MKYRRVEVKPYSYELRCPECSGELRYTEPGVVLTTYPAMYQCTCKKCGHTFTSTNKLNELRYEEVGNFEYVEE